MKLNLTLPMLLAFLLMLITCTPKQPEPAPEIAVGPDFEAAMNGLRDAYVAAVNAGDAVALANLFTGDAVLMEPNIPSVVGKEAIQARFQKTYEAYIQNLAVSIEETTSAGHWGYARGNYTLTLTPKPGGSPVEDTGKWLGIAQHQADGSWKMARHIWNSNNPLPGAAK